ncbi:MAG: hypothetical protein MI919_21680, partial [Holophagales bacterium]|nr:hypothetical protein [Holophagales bacterium]
MPRNPSPDLPSSLDPPSGGPATPGPEPAAEPGPTAHGATPPEPIPRRTLLGGAIAGAAVAGAAGSLAACGGGGRGGEDQAPAIHTRQRVTWRLASSFPRGLDTIFGAAEVLAERLEQMSEGRFRLRVYPAGEIVPSLQVMDAVHQGTVQVGHTAGYYYIGKHQALAFDTCVPFGLTSRQQTAWLTEGGGIELMRELYAEFDMTVYPAGNTGSQMGGWF